ncbi:T9SS type A sorting domain-containing protein [Brumimicrobium aurantiacum]|uniref:T9SS C-terminal target domain-containing protein n=1 Tax=Brumimicrobium aurantiacum TaxID=1737063 RepID=A0A3E1EUS4_9FLAO|nr:T9SS type A sorting domain-containing protein [Brumimicrobium aurantiacum]RFC53278.1 T9SS C-terminal target domain-containing protein [Brumimicrobium aurantiacum]
MKKTILILSAVGLSLLGKELNAQQIPTQDLVVEYKFDTGNFIETSGSSYNAGGITPSHTASFVPGIEQGTSAISPDGASLSNVGNITFSGNVKEYVVSFWFKANQGTGDFQLLELKDPGSSNGLTIDVLNFSNNTSALTVSQASIGVSPTGTYNTFASYLDNEWHHLVVKMVYWTSGGKYYLRTYLDDVEVLDKQYTVSLSNVWVFGGLDIYLPSQNIGNGTSQGLKIDNFRFYEFPITQTDITTLFNEKNASSNCANIVNIPDANFKTALLEHGTTITGNGISTIDTDGDGEICETEAQAYTGKIYVLGQGVNDLTGIEAFTALTHLDCSQNNLTNLDVSANTALLTLNCSFNQLTSLNVANGNNNYLSMMTAFNNPNLTCIQHDTGYTPTPWVQGQGWLKDATASWSTNCNSSCANIVNIPDANFKAALLAQGTTITGNGISPIDTDGDGEICETEAQAYTGNIQIPSQGISDLTGIEAFTALTVLNCSSNQLTNLDVSANTALLTLNCTFNQLTSLNVANGNNNNMSMMTAFNNPNLTCIQHDTGYTPTPWVQGEGWLKDATASWSENCGTAGIEDFDSALNISIYPNPTNGDFTINLGETIESLTVYITDITGKEVYSNGFKSTEKVNLNLNDAPGVYFVTILANGSQLKYKLIKK